MLSRPIREPISPSPRSVPCHDSEIEERPKSRAEDPAMPLPARAAAPAMYMARRAAVGTQNCVTVDWSTRGYMAMGGL